MSVLPPGIATADPDSARRSTVHPKEFAMRIEIRCPNPDCATPRGIAPEAVGHGRYCPICGAVVVALRNGPVSPELQETWQKLSC